MRAALTFAFALASALVLADGAHVTLGTFRSGERVSPPADHAPARVSQAQVMTVEALRGRAQLKVPVTGGGRLLLLVRAASAERSAHEAAPATSVTTPSGLVLGAGDSASADQNLRRYALAADDATGVGLDLPAAQEAIEVKNAEAGLFTLDVDARNHAAVTVVAAEPESSLVLEAWAGPLSRRPTEPVILHAELRDGKAGVPGAQVIARFAAPGDKTGRSVRLSDDGRHEDGAPNDGVYGAVLEDLAGPSGLWSVRFDATGSDRRGVAFARTSSSGFASESPATRLIVRATEARFVGQGAERRLRVTTAARSEAGGLYRLDVIVAGTAVDDGSRPGIAWAESVSRLEPGRTALSVDIPVALLASATADAVHLDVRLVGLDPMGVAGRATLEIPIER